MAHTPPRASLRPLTKRQREIFDWVVAFIGKHGYAPSLEEIGSWFHLTSLGTVHKHLEHIQEKGWIRRAFGRSRHLQIVAQEIICQFCGAPVQRAAEETQPVEAEGRSL